MPRLVAPLLCLCLFGCGGAREQPVPAATGASKDEAHTVARHPKPGERVRQPELDGYCRDPERAGAYYYHGGNPVVRIARKDGCAPLYITECESEGRCYPPRDQEFGMWCCADAHEHQAAQAAR